MSAPLIYLITLVAVFGLLIGSFLNVVVYRVPAGKSLLPSSRCPNCAAAIRPWQNVPVLSWLVLRGRCTGCDERISARYPLVELGTGFAFAGIAVWWFVGGGRIDLGSVSSWLMLFAYLMLAAVTISLALIDLDTFRLPDVIVLPSIAMFALIIGVSTLFGAAPDSLLRALAGGAILALFYGLIWFFWPGGMGFGDVKLAGLLGLALAWIGWGALLVGAFAAFVFGGIFGIALILLGRAKRRSRIPFGPWMIAGAWLGIVAGESIAAWYINAFIAR